MGNGLHLAARDLHGRVSAADALSAGREGQVVLVDEVEGIDLPVRVFELAEGAGLRQSGGSAEPLGLRERREEIGLGPALRGAALAPLAVAKGVDAAVGREDERVLHRVEEECRRCVEGR